MEKKRKLPARAAARAEQAAKRRHTSPPARSATPAPASEPDPEPASPEKEKEKEPPPPLPTSITPGKPLPAVESPQPDDLPDSEYQTVAESGVLGESIRRSRHKWIIGEGMFEKYWTKPVKKRGVVIEEPNNPPKDSMTKIGQVQIVVDPHVFDAVLYAVRDPKPPPPPPPDKRPIIEYGPRNGAMQPPPTPGATTPATPSVPAQGQAPPSIESAPAGPAQPSPSPAPTASAPQPPPAPPAPVQSSVNTSPSTSSMPTAAPAAPPIVSPRGMENVLSPAPAQAQPMPPAQPLAASEPPPPAAPSTHPTAPPTPASGPVAAPAPAPAPPSNGPPTTPTPAPPKPGTDPIILMLAERAGGDPQLRELMKRVAQGNAEQHELQKFQSIIDALTAESKQQRKGPTAAELTIANDGRSVQWFADQVRDILFIVQRTNPRETGSTLIPPPNSDPLCIMLARKALDDIRTRDIVRRVADRRPLFSDAPDLKAILDDFKSKLIKAQEAQKQAQAPALNARAKGATAGQHSNQVNGKPSPAPQQALRSKGPPPPPKPDISAIVVEFVGGNGDRYLFPRYSLLEYKPLPPGQSGQQVYASFLIVHRGSQSEYPVADPSRDYWQAITIRLYAPTGDHLEQLQHVVAPREEVLKYFETVKNSMTRGEYILLAWRLRKKQAGEESEEEEDGGKMPAGKDKEKEKEKGKGKAVNGSSTPAPAGKGKENKEKEKEDALASKKKAGANTGGVLWTTSGKQLPKPELRDLPKGRSYGRAMDADENYQSFIASVSKKES
ncbi:uncharacterized protein CTHT_0018040 [Thermochaetoides thermophila DSM 1495]|uniref:SWR1-complex protein 3 domain-containing protein n=1 Tax=Chaetomium thermophilum (strain DSM 1495 / CBS 144.50 / IMI 039719) TaxID=759272 RepID=G0S2Q0_CHATD|nr:hypothetical protein CTHT_0018040 [Thermochaetoides thermophila DSM 1495]EGS22283.1 hypothetical protein CTHT_0018040 [Thermochaetoides thermophila DSM 1495]